MARKPQSRSKSRLAVQEMRDRFVAIYLAQPIDQRNATIAAIEAGYSRRSAHNAAYRLMNDDEIARRIKGAAKKILDRYEVTADRVVRELARLGFSNMKDVAGKSLEEMSEDESACLKKLVTTTRSYADPDNPDETIEEVTTTLELVDKVRPLHLLGQHMGIFTEGAADPVQFTLIINTSPQRPVLRNVTPQR